MYAKGDHKLAKMFKDMDLSVDGWTKSERV